MKIMLITEDKELARTVRKALQETDARLVSVVGTAKEAVEAFQQHQPGLVILETFLPEGSGTEMMKILNRMNENCLFMMLSRLRTRTAIERAFRLGAQDVLVLPVDAEVIRNTILHRIEAGSQLGV